MTTMTDFEDKFESLVYRVMRHGTEVEVGEWQSQDVSDKPHMVSRELRHETFKLRIPQSQMGLVHEVKPNLPWAEDHFQERVGGEPVNPPPSEAWWPFAVAGNAAHKEGEKFSHSYPERIWPRRAERHNAGVPDLYGVRYRYGDLEDVLKLLTKNPQTRQAFLPIWFPEDTGAHQGQRVPCTLGYHFLIRAGYAEIVYYIRSCDLLRHFTDDVYMAGRLLQWVVGKLQGNGIDVKASSLIMHISSLHVFRGDYPRLEQIIANMGGDEVYGAAV
jgi:thymidylate synthase